MYYHRGLAIDELGTARGRLPRTGMCTDVMQKSTVVEVGAITSAQDVGDAIESGQVGPCNPDDNERKRWTLFSLAQDFGMVCFSLPTRSFVSSAERSIRRFEALADIRAPWEGGKRWNFSPTLEGPF